MKDLIALHEKYEDALFAENIRNPLGSKTDVNDAIRTTLADDPEHFFYMNNGVTILAANIAPKKAANDGEQTLDLRGLSVINGAQTIATAAAFKAAQPDADISKAKVTITLIAADAMANLANPSPALATIKIRLMGKISRRWTIIRNVCGEKWPLARCATYTRLGILGARRSDAIESLKLLTRSPCSTTIRGVCGC